MGDYRTIRNICRHGAVGNHPPNPPVELFIGSFSLPRDRYVSQRFEIFYTRPDIIFSQIRFKERARIFFQAFADLFMFCFEWMSSSGVGRRRSGVMRAPFGVAGRFSVVCSYKSHRCMIELGLSITFVGSD
jgi:hypothetical protein